MRVLWLLSRQFAPHILIFQYGKEYCILYGDPLQGLGLEVALIMTGWLHSPRGWQADASAAALRPIVQPTYMALALYIDMRCVMAIMQRFCAPKLLALCRKVRLSWD